MLILLLLSSCAQSSPRPSDSTVPDSAAAPVPMIAFTADEPAYTIIYPEHLIGPLLDSARELYKTLRSETGSVSLDMTNDWLKAGTEGSPYEILIGQTNRPETAAVMAKLGYSDYAVEVVGSKLVILGGSSDGTAAAIEYFLQNCLKNNSVTLPADYAYHYRSDKMYDGVLLDSIPLGTYTLVYNSTTKPAAVAALDAFSHTFGLMEAIDTANDNGKETAIVLGSTPRKPFSALPFYTYEILVEGKTIYINAHDAAAYEMALAHIRDVILKNNGRVDDLGRFATQYTLPEREQYIKDPSLLQMRWALRDEVAPDWLLDYEARKTALTNGADGRILSISHRADFQYYPENSIESIISCYYLGVDILELDIQPTKDNVLILMHDDTLTRMTDAEKYIGTEGYPNSDKVADWTLEQIKVLRLKEGQGGKTAALTEFRVPTLEEALLVARERMFIVPDKQDYWRYIDTDAAMTASGKAYLYTDMVKSGNYESILISYRVSAAEGCSIQKQILERTGIAPLIYIRGKESAMAGNLDTLRQSAQPGTFLLQINGAFEPDDETINSYRTVIKPLGDITVGAWTITDETDIESVWKTMQDIGIDIIMTNHPHELIDFIMANYKPNNNG